MNYKRILLKISGEALSSLEPSSSNGFGINQDMLFKIAKDIKVIHDQGVEIAVVVGGGNFFRGAHQTLPHLDRASADYMGMLATIMNGTALHSVFVHEGIACRHISSLPVHVVAETYSRERVIQHLNKKRVVVFSGGTGNPFFTTDTAAVLRAREMECDILLKATKVDGVYSSDPLKNSDAKRYERVSFDEVIQNKLNVMDATAITLAQENKLPIAVFSIYEDNNFAKVLSHDGRFTLIKG
ncbi:MAG: UMP kinase [Proteobacteria bacterium]|nr:UMP kinase [Pseudomonadota bacterium]